jgi:microcystin degradation protein MlrC
MSVKKLFVGSIATETNTFSPVPIDINAFKQTYYAPGEHPQTPTLCSGVFVACREKLAPLGWQLIEGTATWAEPAGIVNGQTWLKLKNTILDEVRTALPLDAVVLGLHGAMVAQGEDDCEGSLLAAVRELVGPNTLIAASFDPHSHLTKQRVDNSNLLMTFKEFPHSDFMDTANDLVEATIKTLHGDFLPHIAVFDCRMIEVFPTSIEPMRSFVDKLRALESSDPDIINISITHGFMAGDVPEMGTKISVTTNNKPEKGAALARELGLELFTFRGKSLPPFINVTDGLTQAQEQIGDLPVIVADVWDNPGGGVAGDATLILQEVINRNLSNVGFATIWDPIAVSTCIAAGEGAKIDLRFGGKNAFTGGDPINAHVKVKKIVFHADQTFEDSIVPMGDSVCIEFNGIELILNSNRAQVFSPSLFRNLGIDPAKKDILIVKSTNHFYAAFSKLSQKIIYIDAGAPYPSNPRVTAYRKVRRDIWPIIENPFPELEMSS